MTTAQDPERPGESAPVEQGASGLPDARDAFVGDGALTPIEDDAEHAEREREAQTAQREAAADIARHEVALRQLEVRKAELENDRLATLNTQAEDTKKLRKWAGWAVYAAALLQVLAADAVFIIYASNTGWDNVADGTMNTWIGAAVVQVVGVAAVVTRSIFPSK